MYYWVKSLEESIKKKVVKQYIVVDKNYKPVVKPIYVYFMAYYCGNNELRIPEQTLSFLKELNIDISKKTKDGTITNAYPGNIIIDFNSIPDIEN